MGGETIAEESANEPMDSGDVAPNDRVSLRMADLHTYETRTVDFVSFGGADGNNFFTVSQPFSADHRQKRIHLNYKGTTSSAACSGRGLCDGCRRVSMLQRLHWPSMPNSKRPCRVGRRFAYKTGRCFDNYLWAPVSYFIISRVQDMIL